MILPGSYANGFAPRDGRPLYPELWRGCVGAWAPCLGPTGLTMRDWSGKSNHGVLTNFTAANAYAVTFGKYAIQFVPASSTYVSVSSPFTNKRVFAFSAWVFVTSSSIGRVFTLQSGTNTTFLSIKTETGNVVAQSQIGGTAYESSLTIQQNTWVHVGGIWTGSAVAVVRSGIIGSYVTDLHSQTSLDTFRFGAINGFSQGLAGLIDDVRIFDTVPSQSTWLQLALRRGIAYELAPRRRSGSVAGFNRRRRLLVGAGS